MKTLTKDEVISHIQKIENMSKREAIDFRRKISLADIDGLSKNFLLKAVEVIIGQDTSNVLVVDGEILYDELFD